MKRMWILVFAAALLLTGCARAETEAPAEEHVLCLAETAETEKDGVRLRADSFVDGVLHVTLSNRSGAVCYYGEGFALYRRNDEGGWTHVPDDRSWIAIAYELDDGDDVELSCDLAELPLETGSYKLVRDGLELPFRLITVIKEK